MKYCYSENIASGGNGNHIYFHGCTCLRCGVRVPLFPYQCNVRGFYPRLTLWTMVTATHPIVGF